MKKVLSIVLSIVMVLCMMPAMAFAGTAAAFTDEAAITHDTAVDTLVTLGVFEGYPDGSFQPAKVVTRAEMAKTIATVLNGGEAPVLSASTTSYNDTKGHWAAPYIEYCTSLGIVEGFNGAFSPDAPVTAEAAAKMILVAQGYNAAVEGMTGNQWASNTNVLANQNGLYVELKDIKTDEGAAREHIAQMLYNVLGAKTIEKSNSVNKITGEVVTTYEAGTKSVGEKYFGYTEATTAEKLAKVTYEPTTKVFSYYLTDTSAVDYTAKTDFSALLGQKVKVLYKETTAVGMFSVDSSVVATGFAGDIVTGADDEKIKIDGVEYKCTDESALYYVAEFSGSTTDPEKFAPIKAIDNTGDGKIDAFVYSPVTVAEVAYVGSTQFSLVGSSTTYVKFADEAVTVYDGMAKGDDIAITTDFLTGDTVYTKLEAIKAAKIESKQDSTVSIAGTAYTLDTGVSVSVGSKYDVAILNGYIVDADPVSSEFNAADYAVVTAKNNETTTTHDSVVTTTRVLASNSETKVVKIESDSPVKVNDSTTSSNVGIVKLTDSDADELYTITAINNATNPGVTVNVDAANLAFVKKTDDAAAHITYNTTTKYGIDADAVVFVATADAKNNLTYSVITGAELATKTNVTVKEIVTKTNATTGYDSVVMALVSAVDTTSSNYAYVTALTKVTDLGDSKYTCEVSLSTGKILKSNVNAATAAVLEGLSVGDVLSYTVKANGELGDIHAVTLTPYHVQKYDGEKIKFATKQVDCNITKDTKIIYVDSSDFTKVFEGGTVKLYETDLQQNVAAKVDASNNVLVMLVDINNDWVPSN